MEAKYFVAEILKREVEIPNKPAYIFLGVNAQRTVLTFSDVINLSRKFAARLRGFGVTRGDVVCNTLPTSPERLISHYGTIMAGAIAMVGQICRADGTDFLASLRDARAKAIIYDPNCPAGAYKIFKKAETITTHTNIENYSPETLIPCVVKSNKDKRPSLIEELENSTEMFCEDNGPESVCSYLCTSGTTGNFKLVPYTSKFLVDGYVEFATTLEIYSDSVLFNDKPFGWTVGQPSIVFTVGCTRVTVDESVHRGKDYPRFVTRALRLENCSVAVCTPAFLASLVEQTAIENYDDRHLLKSIGVVGAPTTKTVLKAIGILTESLKVLYGSTETFSLAKKTLNRKEQTFTDYLCGPLLAGVDIAVVDSDMKEVTVGNMGEILIKKPMACSGYINNDRANQETFLLADGSGWET